YHSQFTAKMPDKIYFFVDPNKVSDNKFSLNKLESHHLIKVLRKSLGTEIWLINGIGSAYYGVVQNIQDSIASGQILETFPKYGENKIQISLGIGILKKDKMNFVVEKATECGVNKFIPLILDKCIKRDVNLDRLLKISISAVKQSGRSIIPIISRPSDLNKLLNKYSNSSILVFHESGKDGIDILPQLLKNQSKILVLIGPEGDFSKEEIGILKGKKAKFINLGNRRLRSETAVIAALSQINLYSN
ncbi:MAG: 16S rRNA (uracil(1498)-N(3))-methyltransferase, partial [Candidatus Marinimicrobia bacterium]|nr:16S rRNA (uracil(1498)-N(3))-methyltransferase [Candidatus Neomarinimicrobiota bacterium]